MLRNIWYFWRGVPECYVYMRYVTTQMQERLDENDKTIHELERDI